MNKLAALALVLSVTACFGEDAAGRVPAPLIEACGAEYSCEYPDGSVEVMESTPEDGKCELDEFGLSSDGHVNKHGSIQLNYWVGDSDLFSVCHDETGECVTCGRTGPLPMPEPSSPTPEGDSESGRCTGNAANCANLSTSSCWNVDGCYTSSRFSWNGDLERYCSGISERRDDYTWESACERQRGCEWSPN
ncbi:MAG: hypothetical protein DRJ42_25100 [Deltaproteobacteria bacterium]|nr:MAG: hypothetical protein DRJ42_25100 [Deltaproteobacteria bacterium]